MVELEGKEVILTGILPEVMPPGKNQPPMTFSVEPGSAYIGAEVGRLFGLEEGDEINILGTSLKIEKRLSPTGSSDDIRVYGQLADVQKILGLEGRINEIRALECLCLIESGETDLDPLTLAQQQLAEILPDAQVLLLQGIAEIRQRQRAAMEGYLALFMPVVIIVCGIWIGALAMLNVRQRIEEIGIMRALGHSGKAIAVLLLGRSVIIGFVGAIIGFILGTLLALVYGPRIFQLTASALKPEYIWLLCVLIVAPLFAAAASLIPTLTAMSKDPASTLKRE
jgi:ABC-type lipoprotein release transport system permease subunit